MICLKNNSYTEFNGEFYKDYRMKMLLLDIHKYLTRCNRLPLMVDFCRPGHI